MKHLRAIALCIPPALAACAPGDPNAPFIVDHDQVVVICRGFLGDAYHIDAITLSGGGQIHSTDFSCLFGGIGVVQVPYYGPPLGNDVITAYDVLANGETVGLAFFPGPYLKWPFHVGSVH